MNRRRPGSMRCTWWRGRRPDALRTQAALRRLEVDVGGSVEAEFDQAIAEAVELGCQAVARGCAQSLQPNPPSVVLLPRLPVPLHPPKDSQTRFARLCVAAPVRHLGGQVDVSTG